MLLVSSIALNSACSQLKASFDGFRLVLIGDMHEQPMVHLKVKRFIVGAKDWSGAVGILPMLVPLKLKQS